MGPGVRAGAPGVGANLAVNVGVDAPAALFTRTQADDGAVALHLAGRLGFADAGQLWVALGTATAPVTRGHQLDFDMTQVERVDGGSMALLVQLRADLHGRGARSEFIGASAPVQAIIRLYRGDVRAGPLRRRRAPSLLAQVGDSTWAFAAGHPAGLRLLRADAGGHPGRAAAAAHRQLG